ncbi:MAG: nucleotidyltransferase family protein [Maribacter sp.]|nr:nucleotidyltransferase family protein [Maribacter sp.]
MAENENIAVVILAAGESSRMQKTKQLLPWGKSTLLGSAIKEALESNAENVYVVLGAKAETIQMQLEKSDVDLIFNNDWKKGMGSSISCAINYLLHLETNYDGILIMLCDQPLIDAIYLNKMISTFKKSGKGIVATAYESRNGVPVLFNNKYFEQLSLLDSDKGAKAIIMDNPTDVLTIIPMGKEIDLDTIEEYEQALKSHK